MVVISILSEKRNVDPWLATLVIMLLGLAVGGLNGFLVTRVGLPSFIATLGMWGALRGAGNLFSGGIASASTRTELDHYRFFGSNRPGTRVPTIFPLMLGVLLIAAVLLGQARLGR